MLGINLDNLIKRKIKLKHRLLIVYTLFILVLISALIYMTSEIFKTNFENYVSQKHELFANDVVDEVLYLYETKGQPTYDDLYKIGLKSFNEGMIFMLNESVDQSLICMSDIFPTDSDDMIRNMERSMKSIYPHSTGEYIEDIYIVENGDETFGYVTLGYYGPMYYTEFDLFFLGAVKQSIYVVGFIFFISSSFILYILVERMTKPINLASDKAEEISKGNFSDLIENDSNTIELYNLVSSINSLSKKLGEQHKIKKQLAENYAHEIRTPLMCAMTTIEGIQDGVFGVTDERLEVLYKDIERIQSLICNLDKLVETSNQMIVLNKTEFDLNELMESIILSFKDMFINKNIEISFEKCYDSIVVADKEQIFSLLTNFISNAYKYTNNNGKVDVKIVSNKNSLNIHIKDNGIGIEENELELIFEHLYRIDKSRVKTVDGFGIGLALCKNIVLAHKGKIEVISKINVGSEFIITLPKNRRIYEKKFS